MKQSTIKIQPKGATAFLFSRSIAFLYRRSSATSLLLLCICLTLFTACEKWTLDRIPVNCTNYPENCVNGTCINDVCVCNTGWYGENCTSQNPADSTSVALNCDNIDCGENGNCINGVCVCEDFYWGDNCENEMITFKRSIGVSGGNVGYDVIQTADKGFIVLGSINLNDNIENDDIYLIKTDENGVEQWSKTFGGNGGDYANSIAQTTDGGFIICGRTESFGAGSYDIYLIKTDPNGDEQWYKTFGGSEYNQGYSVIQTYDGGYIITGNLVSGNIIKTDSDGNVEWIEIFENGNSETNLAQTADGGFVITSITHQGDVYLTKANQSGNEEWSKTYGGSEIDKGNSVVQTTDGGFIITGWTESFGTGSTDVYLIKTDANGNEQWSKTFGGSEWDGGNSVAQTGDGGYIICGQTVSFGVGYGDIYLIKTDANGNELWFKTFGGGVTDRGESLMNTFDEGFIITGSVGEFIYLIKTDANGNVQ